MTRVDEAVREQRHDSFRAAVRLRRDGKPHRADEAYAHELHTFGNRDTPALDGSRPRAAERADALDAEAVEPAR